MKYLAILKDSFREAIDNKVIFVMVGLALLVTLFVLSVGFEPMAPEAMMARLLRGDILRLDDLHGGGMREEAPRAEQGAVMPADPVEGGKARPPPAPHPGGAAVKEGEPGKRAAQQPALGQFAVHQVEAVRGPAGSPESAYRFTIALPLPTKEEADKVRANPTAEAARL